MDRSHYHILSTSVLMQLLVRLLFSSFYLSTFLSVSFADEREEFFEKHIRPVLVEHCYECHSAEAKTVQANLLLDTPSATRTGGDSGPSVVPNNVDESLIVQALEYETWQMPPSGKLPAETIANFRRWIAEGAVDPRPESSAPSPQPGADRLAAGKTHWSFQPIQRATIPTTGSNWPRNSIDCFIENAANQHHLPIAMDADRATLLRRLYLTLIGLPPTAEEVLSFLTDQEPDAVERVVDRLLASPHYGERWGRYWLDLARYADSNGADENHEYPVAYRYRDYVVRQLNADLPYDEFVIQQLAGDLLATDSIEQRRENLTATGFLVLGPKMLAEQDKPKLVADLVDEQIDTLGQSLLGLTLGCARCHDHKFDPINATDYYALAGVFHSTKSMKNLDFVSQWNTRSLPDPIVEAQIAEHQRVVAEAEKELTQLTMKPEGERSNEEKAAIEKAKQHVENLKKAAPSLPEVMAVDESSVKLVPIHIRGNHLQLKGDALTRRLPTVFENSMPQPEMPSQQSGRLELAQALFHSQNPLTSRVIANRLWSWHFGEGIVRTVSNFGLKGETPSHPDLLDWLASEIQLREWSIKQMHRQIVLSRTFQLQIQATEEAIATDPDNRFFARRGLKRLEIEPLRDSIVAVGGNLDRSFGGRAATIYGSNYAEDGRGKNEFDALRRMIYLPVNRAALHELFATFDYVDSGVSVGKRTSTVVPHQSLFLMNHPLIRQQASELAKRLQSHSLLHHDTVAKDENVARIQLAFLELLGRLPDQTEIAIAQDFLRDKSYTVAQATPDNSGNEPNLNAPEHLQVVWSEFCHALITSNEFMYIP